MGSPAAVSKVPIVFVGKHVEKAALLTGIPDLMMGIPDAGEREPPIFGGFDGQGVGFAGDAKDLGAGAADRFGDPGLVIAP